MTEIDDDRVLFLIILVGAFSAIFGVVYSYQLTVQPPVRVPTILILMTPDLESKKIITMPTSVPGRLREGEIVPWTCYVYNSKDYNQTVTVSWWLGYQVEEERKYVDFYSYLGGNFTINSWERLECYLSFSIKPDTPKFALNKLENTVIWVDFQSEVLG